MAEQSDQFPMIEPLTRNGYQRLPKIEDQISAMLNRDKKELIAASDDLDAETLCYFVRRAHKQGDKGIQNELFKALVKRCAPMLNKFFQSRGDEKKDLMQEVNRSMVQHLFAEDDIGDFMQVRFWKYLRARVITILIFHLKFYEATESLETGYFGDGTSEGYLKFENQETKDVSPALMAMFSQASEMLRALPLPKPMKAVYFDRHYNGLKTGDLGRKYEVTGQTIRNWIKKVETALQLRNGKSES